MHYQHINFITREYRQKGLDRNSAIEAAESDLKNRVAIIGQPKNKRCAINCGRYVVLGEYRSPVICSTLTINP